ncbi:hypothetical protein D3C84_1134600 [compost metagenome]
MIGHGPDLQHGLVFESVQGIGIVPLFECQPFGVGAVDGVQTHAPMRGRIGNGVVFGFRERMFGH